jgi:hypothetical protein
MLDSRELNAIAVAYGVAEAQVRRDRLIKSSRGWRPAARRG